MKPLQYRIIKGNLFLFPNVRTCVCLINIAYWTMEKKTSNILYLTTMDFFFFGLVFLCEKKLSIFVSGYPRTKQKNLIRLNKSKLPPFFFWILNRPSPISFDFRCLYLYSLPFSHCHCFLVCYVFFCLNFILYFPDQMKLSMEVESCFGHTQTHRHRPKI